MTMVAVVSAGSNPVSSTKTIIMKKTIRKTGKKVRLWIFQNNLSGNANGHFETLELPVKSTRADVFKYAAQFYWKCFNIRDLGVFTSEISDRDFCPKSIGTAIPKKYNK